MISPDLGIRTEPRITEVTDDAQEVEDATDSMLPTMQMSQLALPPNAAHEQSFVPSLPRTTMSHQQSNSQAMHNSQLQLQLDQLRTAQLHQRRLKLEIIERQTREKE